MWFEPSHGVKACLAFGVWLVLPLSKAVKEVCWIPEREVFAPAIWRSVKHYIDSDIQTCRITESKTKKSYLLNTVARMQQAIAKASSLGARFLRVWRMSHFWAFPKNALLVGLCWLVQRITPDFSQVLMQKYIRNRCSTKSLNASIASPVPEHLQR